MPSDEHLAILRRGVKVWNEWRQSRQDQEPETIYWDFSRANLCDANLIGADLSHSMLDGANLRGANLAGADLWRAFLEGADLGGANLGRANLSEANMSGADLSGANLAGADLERSDLTNARMIRTRLHGVDLRATSLSGADMRNAEALWTIFRDADLSEVEGLDTIVHLGPSTVGIDTIYKSQGKIPAAFLRNCGVPDGFIAIIPSLIAALQPIQFDSCFISYSSNDEAFARRLFSRMRGQHLRVWFAPEEMRGGQKLIEQIDRAIQANDRLLVVLSEASMQSEWVKTEIRRARRAELQHGRRKLFPIRLTSIEQLRAWECFDADTGKDLAVEVREYFIPDFSNWNDHGAFEHSFARLLDDLRAGESAKGTWR